MATATSTSAVTALELWNRKVRKLSLGCAHLDSLLGGGLTNNGVIEVAGEAGSGKTQFCLQLCFQVRTAYPKGDHECCDRPRFFLVCVGRSSCQSTREGLMVRIFASTHPSSYALIRGCVGTGTACYVCSEDVPLSRMNQMAPHFCEAPFACPHWSREFTHCTPVLTNIAPCSVCRGIPVSGRIPKTSRTAFSS